MQVIKNINNNVAICLDSRGQEVVAFGKGIGFSRPPYEVDVEQIDRTFYDIDPVYVQTVQHIPDGMLELSMRVVDYARTKVGYLMNSSIVFTLADHLAFTLKRHQEHMRVDMPLYHDVRVLYEDECEIGEYALELVERVFGVRLPKEEVTGIALHLINAGAVPRSQAGRPGNATVIEHIHGMVEGCLGMRIDEQSADYARFVLHLQYLLKRGNGGNGNDGVAVTGLGAPAVLMESLKGEYPQLHACAVQIVAYIGQIFGYEFGDEEELYLMLHLNRLVLHATATSGLEDDEGRAPASH